LFSSLALLFPPQAAKAKTNTNINTKLVKRNFFNILINSSIFMIYIYFDTLILMGIFMFIFYLLLLLYDQAPLLIYKFLNMLQIPYIFLLMLQNFKLLL